MDMRRIQLMFWLLGFSAAVGATQPPSTSTAAVAQPNPCSTAPDGSFTDPSTDTAYLERRGISEALHKNFTQALGYLQRACELAPDNPEYVYTVGRVEWMSGHPDLALPYFERTLTLNPDDPRALLARAQLRSKEHARAKADLDAVDRIVDPKDDMRLEVGLAYEAIGEFAAAVHQYDVWLQSRHDDPRRVVGLDARCRARAEGDLDLDQALQDCDAALAEQRENSSASESSGGFIHPRPRDNPDILASRGFVRLRRGEFERAIKDYDAAVADRPRVAEYRFARGLAKLRAGRQSDGQADIAAATAMEKNIAERFAAWGLKP